MNWKIKSWLQRCCDAIPGGGLIYNQFQRRLGGLRQPEYMNKFKVQKKMALMLRKHDVRIDGAEVVEVGTGWIPLIPIGFWICGASRVRTYDLHRYLELPLLRQSLHWISANAGTLQSHYAEIVPKRMILEKFEVLNQYKDQPMLFLNVAGIEYHAPADAAKTKLPAESVDIHFSANCFEHIPAEVLSRILGEARRILKHDGIAVHHVDPSDHFSHCDPSITSINFLRYEPDDWKIYNQNRFAYHNRLRDRDYRQLFVENHLNITESEFEIDGRAINVLKSGFPLARAYRNMPHEELCRYCLDYVARPGVLASAAVIESARLHAS